MRKYFSLFIFAVLFFYSIPFVTSAALNLPPNNNGLVGYWSFDEGTSTIAHDFSGNGNNGSMQSGPTWTNGKRSNAFLLNGSTQYITFPSVISSGDFTASAWVKFTGSSVSNWKGIFSGTLSIGMKDGFLRLTQTNVSDAGQGPFMSTGVWQHIAVSYNSSTGGIVYYLNGVPSSTSFTSGLNASIGAIGGVIAFSGMWEGGIDEARIYNRVLSSSEVQALYNSGTTKISSSKIGKITNGLVGLWTFDGGDMTSTVAYDRSGSGNNGTLQNAPKVTEGQTGQALNFNGGSYITVNPPVTSVTSDRTVSAWVKNSTSGSIYGNAIDAGSGGGEYHLDGPCNFNVHGSRSPDVWVTATASIDSGWHMCTGTVTMNGNVSVYVDGVFVTSTNYPYSSVLADGLCLSGGKYAIGEYNSCGTDGSYFSGTIDSVRVYNRALSAAEIKQLYGVGATTKISSSKNSKATNGLIGLWSFDGPDVTDKIYDRSGQGNHAYYIGGATTTVVTEGKVGQALSFNGSTQYVKGPNPMNIVISAPFSVSAWVKTSSSGTTNSIVSTWKGPSSGAGGFWLYINDTNHLELFMVDNPGYYWARIGSTNIPDGNWHLVTATYDGSGTGSISTVGVNLYVDGVLESSTSDSNNSLSTFTSDIITIGSLTGNSPSYFNGSIDNVRVYNRALSASEVKQLYNTGK